MLTVIAPPAAGSAGTTGATGPTGPTGPTGAPAAISAANAAALTASSDAPLAEGALGYVETYRDYFALRKTSSRTLAAHQVLATASGTGRWERLKMPHPSWLTQATWVVDAAAGDDANTGVDSANALKTDAERQRRWGPIAYLSTSVTVTTVGSLPATDPLNGEIRLLPGGKFVLQGTPTVTRTSAFTAVTAINRAAAQALHVTDGSFDWTSSVGSQIVIPSGARAGLKTFVAKAVGAGVARLGPGLVPPTFEWDLPVALTPVAADPYQVRTVPDVYLGDMRVVNANDVSVGSTSNTLLVQDVRLRGDSGIKGVWETRGVAGNFNGGFDARSE